MQDNPDVLRTLYEAADRHFLHEPFPAYLIASDTSIEGPLELVKLFEGICKGGCEIASRFAVQSICLD
jgi:hypothetical protein